MLVHELFQEQVIQDRAQELVRIRPRRQAETRARVPYFLGTIVPAATHGPAGIPPPAGGC